MSPTLLQAALLFFFGLLWLCFLFYLLKKNKGFLYIFSFTVFYIYVYKVLDYTLFQFQSLIILKYFMPGLMLQGLSVGESMNLIPLITLGSGDIKTSLLNILMMVPFGLGLPFITQLRMKKVILAGMFFSVAIEVLQFVTGLIAGTTFRVADINDLIFNTIGVVIGYVLFIVSMFIYGLIFSKAEY